MLFTYEIKIQLGQDRTITKEVDARFEYERNGDWSIYLLCDMSGEYEPVYHETDLYKEICKFLMENSQFGLTQDAIDDARRGFRWSDRRLNAQNLRP